MARFRELNPKYQYDIIDGESGHWLTQGIQGADAMQDGDWPEGAEAWPSGEEDFSGRPLAVAK